MLGSEDTCCPLALWCLQCFWRYSAERRKSESVTVCGRKFPPTISKHCPHQHSATHKTVQQYETPSIPAVLIPQHSLFPQTNITQPLFIPTAGYCLVSLHVCQNTKTIITKTQFLFITETSHRTPQISTQTTNILQYISISQCPIQSCDSIIQLSNKLRSSNCGRMKFEMQIWICMRNDLFKAN